VSQKRKSNQFRSIHCTVTPAANCSCPEKYLTFPPELQFVSKMVCIIRK